MRNPFPGLGPALGRALHVIVVDRHDAVGYIGLLLLAVGVWEAMGRAWAFIAVGAVLLAFTWRGLR